MIFIEGFTKAISKAFFDKIEYYDNNQELTIRILKVDRLNKMYQKLRITNLENMKQ